MLFSDLLGRNPLFSRFPKTLRREPSQPSAVQIQIRQGEVHAQPLVVLAEPAVAGLLDPKMRFTIRKGCSTFALTRALTRFFALCNWST